MINKYRKYRISKSLNGNGIVYLARAGKHKQIIGRAHTENDLVKQMSKAAAELDAARAAEAAEDAKKTEAVAEKESRKPGLWKAGGLLSKKESPKKAKKPAAKKPAKKASKSTVRVSEESL